jgi:hypothetical protein
MDKRKKEIGIIEAAIVMAVFLAMCTPVSAIDPITSSWSTVAPSIDGNFIAGEWENPQLLIPSPIHTYVYFVNDNENLYICVDAANGAAGDYTKDDSDACELIFDTYPREEWSPGHEDGFSIVGNGIKVHYVYNGFWSGAL